jgi:phosphatidylserine decarboxylase
MKDALIVSVLSLMPRKTGARAMGALARRPLSKLMTRAFVRLYGVDMSEAQAPAASYTTLEALFTRTLRKGARPIDDTPNALVSPVDGRCAAVGKTQNGCIDLAPGRQLDIAKLIGQQFDDELDVAVLYLSPKDYHRVHIAREGEIVRWRYVPGTLWPVFPAAVRKVDGLFSRNERVVVEQDTTEGPLWSVLIGAFGVGRITLSACDIVTNAGRDATEANLAPAMSVDRGEELGVFHLGSTVVLAAPRGRWRLTGQPGEVVRVGRTIGTVTPQLTGPV